MGLIFWITISFIAIGFIVLTSMKRNMENKLAFITAKMESEESSTEASSIIWWIGSAAVWGIVSMVLVVWSFHNYFG